MRDPDTLDAADVTVVIRVTTTHASAVAARMADALKTALGHADVAVALPARSTGGPALRILPDSRRVLHKGVPVPLTRLEFDLLLHLCREPGRVHGRSALMDRVWRMSSPVDTRTIDVHVRRIRAKLGRDGAEFIGTVRGVGYRVERAHLVRVEDEG